MIEHVKEVVILWKHFNALIYKQSFWCLLFYIIDIKELDGSKPQIHLLLLILYVIKKTEIYGINVETFKNNIKIRN